MSRLYQRLKGALHDRLYSSRSYYDPYSESYNEEKKDHSKELDETVETDNRSQQRTSQRRARERTPLEEDLPSTPPELRPAPKSSRPNLPRNNNINTNRPINANTTPVSNSPINPNAVPFSNPPINPNTIPIPNPPINFNTAPISNPPINFNTAPISNPPINFNTAPISNPPINFNTVPISNPPINPNAVPISNSPAPIGLLPQDPSSSNPTTTPNQLPLPAVKNIPRSPIRGDFLSTIRAKRRPFIINPNSTLVGFPQSRNSQSPWFGRSSFSPQQQQQIRPYFPSHFLPSPLQKNISNIEIDYPIENVLIDEDIPSSIAIKLNEAIEHDRFGNTYYTQHYAYQPKTQHIAMNNYQQIERRLIENSHPTGLRHIREIDYPQKRNFDNIQLFIDNRSQLNSFPLPINHFTAYASTYDPMRCY